MIARLECGRCGRVHEDGPRALATVSRCCGKPLLARYDLAALRGRVTRSALEARRPGLWRYAEVLPVEDARFRFTLGEGGTPLLAPARLREALGIPNLAVKEEGLNPTGSFKARGLAMAVSANAERGARGFAVPSAGNAAAALAAYAAAAGLPAHVFMPRDVPPVIREECEAFGARVTLVSGLITDAAKEAQALVAKDPSIFDVSTLKEPYRAEGKKTMGYEVVQDLGWTMPDVVVYPTGGGTGIVGMWKAFAEMEALGLVGPERPRLVTVQSEGCAPLVAAFEAGREDATPWENAATRAAGLRVPRAIGDFLVLRALRASGGTAVAVSEKAIAEGTRDLARAGIYAAPEGGATVAAARLLADRGWIRPSERVVLFNTGSGFPYAAWRE